jgi:hypothetical protein
MKKAQGLPINTIILAILAIAVLFIILFLVVRKGGEFAQATSNCESLGGKCISGGCSSLPSGIPVSGNCPQGQSCCRELVPQKPSGIEY